MTELSAIPGPASLLQRKPSPTRTCVGCGVRAPAEDFLRYRVTPDCMTFDAAGMAHGRSAYVHPDCGMKAAKRRSRAIPVDFDAVFFELQAESRKVYGGAQRARRVSLRGALLTRLASKVSEAQSRVQSRVVGTRGGSACKLPEVP